MKLASPTSTTYLIPSKAVSIALNWTYVRATTKYVFKGKLHSKIISSDMIYRVFFRRIRWWRSEVEIRTGRRSNRRRKTGTCEHLWRHGATLVPPRNHGKVTRLNQDIRDQPESARVKWWHDADTTITAIVISLIIVTQSSHDASNLDPMSQEIFVTIWYFGISVFYLHCSLCNGNAGATYNFRKTKTKANKQTDNKRQSRRQGRIQQKKENRTLPESSFVRVCVSFVSER